MPATLLNPEELCFNTGEISPIMFGRIDLPKYGYACKTMQNMLLFLQGPTFRRPGTQFIGNAKNSDKLARLIPFIFSTTDAYIIEAGTNYLRFWRTNPDTGETGLILKDGIPYEISTVFAENELIDIHFDQVEDLMYLCHPNHPMQKLIRHDHDNWEIADVPIEDGPFLPDNKTDTTITPSGTTGTINLTASSDIFTAKHVGSLWKIVQTRPTASVKGKFSGVGKSGSITIQENTSIRITTHGSWTGSLSVEKSYDKGVIWDEVFSLDVEKDDNMLEEFEETVDEALYRLNMTSGGSGCTYNLNVLTYEWYGIVRITGYVDPKNVKATVLTALQGVQTTTTTEEKTQWGWFGRKHFTKSSTPVLQSTKATKKWAEGAWSLEQGYPTTLTFFQQRLFVASKSHRAPRIWASQNFEFENFFEGPDADDALYFYLSTTKSNPIVWLTPSSQSILIGTSYQSSSIQPVNVEGGIQTFSGPGGSGAIQPDKFETGKLSGNTILFIERQGQKVCQIVYSTDVYNYMVVEDISILAEHITKPLIIGMCFQQQPIPILWMVRSDGVVVSMVYSKVHDVVAFASHPMTNGFVESVAVIPSAVTGQDEVWLLVKRDVGGNKRYIERLNPIKLDANIEDCQYLDCSLSKIYGTPTKMISGLDHLIGETVDILADGVAVDSQAVDGNGKIELDTAASKVVVGLSYISTLTTLDLQFSFQNGSTKGKKIKIAGTNLDLYATGKGVKFGSDASHLTELDLTERELFSGIYPRMEREVPFYQTDWQKETSITLVQDAPLPLVIRSIIVKAIIEGI
jgi:hypothetical protein